MGIKVSRQNLLMCVCSGHVLEIFLDFEVTSEWIELIDKLGNDQYYRK